MNGYEQLCQQPDKRRLFLREVNITARLQHPGVVPIWEANDKAPDRRATIFLTAATDGRLTVRIPAEVEQSFGESNTVALAGNSRWEILGAELQSAGPEAKVYAGKLPNRCFLTVQLTAPPTGRAGLWLGGDAKNEQALP